MQSELPEFESSPRPPEIVERMWAAKDAHYRKPHPTKLTYGRMTTLLQDDGFVGAASSQAAQERARRDYPDLFPKHWPLRKEDVRPWLADPSVLVEALAKARAKTIEKARAKALAKALANGRNVPEPPTEADDAKVVVWEGRIQMTMDPSSGKLIARLASLAVAGLSTAAVLDLTDGRFDHIIHWCRVLLGVHRILV